MSNLTAPTIRYFRNDDKTFILNLKDKYTKEAVNLTGKTVKLTVNSLENPPDATTKMFDVDAVIISATAGRVSFTPTKTDSAAAAGDYFYDVQVTTTATSVVDTAGKGKFILIEDITK